MGTRRNVVRLELLPEADDVVEREARARDMKKNAVVSRILTWFAWTDEVVRDAVLGVHSRKMGAAYANALREIAKAAETATENDEAPVITTRRLGADHRPARERRQNTA